VSGDDFCLGVEVFFEEFAEFLVGFSVLGRGCDSDFLSWFVVGFENLRELGFFGSRCDFYPEKCGFFGF